MALADRWLGRLHPLGSRVEILGNRHRGICVRTWAMWLQALAVELMIVVSEIGEQWSPKMAPSSTAATLITVIGP